MSTMNYCIRHDILNKIMSIWPSIIFTAAFICQKFMLTLACFLTASCIFFLDMTSSPLKFHHTHLNNVWGFSFPDQSKNHKLTISTKITFPLIPFQCFQQLREKL